MQNLLLKYLNERMEPRILKPVDPGPVITISREAGCPGAAVAQSLTDKINKILKEEGARADWKWVNKEILRTASQELRMEPEKIRTIREAGHKGAIEEFVFSFTESYYGQSDRIKKVIGEVIRRMAVDGNIIIVGRGSGAITRDIPKSLHINLEAPLPWRMAMESEKKNLPLNEAKKRILEIDKERKNFRDYFLGKTTEDNIYDLSFNCMHFSIEEIADSIVAIARIRKLL